MKSSIRIDFVDRGTGVGVEPVIKVELKNSDDPRDKLLSVLFDSTKESNFLQFFYSRHEQCPYPIPPGLEKQILIFNPEIDMDELLNRSIKENIAIRRDEQGKLCIVEVGSGSNQ